MDDLKNNTGCFDQPVPDLPYGCSNEKPKRVNIYSCPNGHKTISRDIDEGVTPSSIVCQHSAKEGKKYVLAFSHFYNVPSDLWDDAEIEWYKPKYPERIKDAALRQHVDSGGLLRRYVGQGEETESMEAPKSKSATMNFSQMAMKALTNKKQ